jgi:hypothetical protein
MGRIKMRERERWEMSSRSNSKFSFQNTTAVCCREERKQTFHLSTSMSNVPVLHCPQHKYTTKLPVLSALI